MFTCCVYDVQAHARRALDFLWEKRQRNSNLVGTTINIHSGEWVRRGRGGRGSCSRLYQTVPLFRETLTCILDVFLYSVIADSGVGAGIDSYYEYLLKAYVLLGDDQLLQRFNIVSRTFCYIETYRSLTVCFCDVG